MGTSRIYVEIYNQEVKSDWHVLNCFERFVLVEMKLEDKLRPGRSLEIDVVTLKTLVESEVFVNKQ